MWFCPALTMLLMMPRSVPPLMYSVMKLSLLSFAEHPDELEHIWVLQASHDLHLGSGVQRSCAPIFSCHCHKPPWTVLKEGISTPHPLAGGCAHLPPPPPPAWAAPPQGCPCPLPCPLAVCLLSIRAWRHFLPEPFATHPSRWASVGQAPHPLLGHVRWVSSSSGSAPSSTITSPVSRCVTCDGDTRGHELCSRPPRRGHASQADGHTGPGALRPGWWTWATWLVLFYKPEPSRLVIAENIRGRRPVGGVWRGKQPVRLNRRARGEEAFRVSLGCPPIP